MLRFLTLLALVAVTLQDNAGTTIKKNYGFMDPPFCFVYHRVETSPDVFECNGNQYDCSPDTVQVGDVETFPANCDSNNDFRAFANADFKVRYAAVEAG
ncbi:unnamed protein product [Caenorhabditis auriculariae]|uniref:Uncharacterized protein n=1 Tax=Caenorhabditis auriculariae TaxID=2777116 RepID=A0A8S1HVS8_9PELO|nr:unnamed protein product [Caenorhabditis auriculariae]